MGWSLSFKRPNARMDKKKLIVFCGMDASGKTTLARKVQKFLNSKGIDSEFKHGHNYAVSKDSFGFSEEKIKKIRYILRLIIPLVLFDNLFTFYCKYKPVLKRKNLICDRYFYDKIARMIYYGMCSKTIAKIYLKFIPQPDYIFFLDIDAKTAFLRKREYREVEYENFRKIYKFIAKYLKVPIINTNEFVDSSFRKIIDVFN